VQPDDDSQSKEHNPKDRAMKTQMQTWYVTVENDDTNKLESVHAFSTNAAAGCFVEHVRKSNANESRSTAYHAEVKSGRCYQVACHANGKGKQLVTLNVVLDRMTLVGDNKRHYYGIKFVDHR